MSCTISKWKSQSSVQVVH